jgi:PAS domain S-box-containing protein
MKPKSSSDAEWPWSSFDGYSEELAVVICNPMLPDCPIIYVNDKFLEHSGYERADVIGKNCRFMQGQDSESVSVQQFREAIAGNKMVSLRITNYRKDGTKFANQIMLRPIARPGHAEQLLMAVQHSIELPDTDPAHK